MITSLRLKDFKNFADETLRVGKFTLIVRANASGKSNIRDAFRFLHGVGRGYSLVEIAGGKHEAGWKPIRGAPNGLVRFGSCTANSEGDRFSLEVGMKPDLVIRETNGARVPANCASDGTLRFLAMLAALLWDNRPCAYFFEEIENSVHASRLHLLVNLIEQATSDGTKRVIATTNSPDLLALAADSTFETTSVVCRLEDASKAIIRPVADLANATALRKTQGLGRLLAGGWMETALEFTEGVHDGENMEPRNSEQRGGL